MTDSGFVFQGCIYRLASEMKEHLNILGGVGLGFCVVQIFGLVLACSLYIRLKDPPTASRLPAQNAANARA